MYKQFVKNKERHLAIKRAVEQLTLYREEACCVKRNYVRNIFDYLTLSEDSSQSKTEALKISNQHILDWEYLHASCVGNKSPKELTVCYLCGPEPDNDFNEFINLGVLPSNIWAFESDGSTYNKAVNSYSDSNYPQPRIMHQNLETFFSITPKKFDIIYIDACGSIPSKQHAMRCVTTACEKQRLNSPGIIISNITEPHEEERQDYISLITEYCFYKHYFEDLSEYREIDDSRCYKDLYDDVKNRFGVYYGDFVTYVLMDIPSIYVPIRRFANNPLITNLISNLDESDSNKNIFQRSYRSSMYQFLTYLAIKKEKGTLDKREQSFLDELNGIEPMLKGINIITQLRQGKNIRKGEIKELRDYFETSDRLYQFLDRTHSNLVFDIVANQLSCPLHCVVSKCKRYSYRAKKKRMYTDVMVYDECRYLYEWMPSIDQIRYAFDNPSWQYVMRFALDGLVKERQLYNNEYFYQCAVISGEVEQFKTKELSDREELN